MANPVPKQLTPWKPGQSGNPKGRPKNMARFAKIFGELNDEELKLANGKVIPYSRAVLSVIRGCAMRGQPWAATWWGNRLVPEKVEIDVSDERQLTSFEEVCAAAIAAIEPEPNGHDTTEPEPAVH